MGIGNAVRSGFSSLNIKTQIQTKISQAGSKKITNLSGLAFTAGLYSGTFRNTVYSSLAGFFGDFGDFESKSSFSSKVVSVKSSF